MHTPGLWKRHDRIESTGSYLITDATGEVGIARVIAGTDAKDNAALIVAAPDLLNMAKWAYDAMREMSDLSNGERDIVAGLQAAIAKAEGRNSMGAH